MTTEEIQKLNQLSLEFAQIERILRRLEQIEDDNLNIPLKCLIYGDYVNESPTTKGFLKKVRQLLMEEFLRAKKELEEKMEKLTLCEKKMEGPTYVPVDL